MKTLIFKHKCSNEEDLKTLKLLQHQGSIDFRRAYNNLELLKNSSFLNTLNIKSTKYQNYLSKEIISFHEKVQASKERVLVKIITLKNSEIVLTPKKFKKLKQLEKSYKSDIVFGGRSNLQRRQKGLISNEEFKEHRLYPLTFYGETASKGSRFFDFSDLSNGDILFKLEATKIKIPLTISVKKHKKELDLLQQFSNDKLIPITVRLTHEKIFISFDESILYNSKFDLRKFKNESPNNPIERKQYWKIKHQDHESLLKKGKLERYLSVDLNPNQIGFVITDKDLNVIDKGSFELEGKMSSNKRKYEYSIIIKKLFKKIEHYKCSYFICEDLDKIVKENHGNKVSNRKIKGEWKLNLLKGLIERNCNETKTILVKVNPMYSSFIGNLNFPYYDPISSALELCRRGINKFTKGFKLIPDMDLNNIMTDIATRLQIDYNVDLGSITSYQGLFKSIRNKSYRRKDKTFSSYLLNKKSNVHCYI